MPQNAMRVVRQRLVWIHRCHFFQRLEDVREIGRLVSFLSHQCINCLHKDLIVHIHLNNFNFFQRFRQLQRKRNVCEAMKKFFSSSQEDIDYILRETCNEELIQSEV